MKTLEQLKEEVRIEQKKIAAEEQKYFETEIEEFIKKLLRKGGSQIFPSTAFTDKQLTCLRTLGVHVEGDGCGTTLITI